MRNATVHRKTNETDIRLRLELDGTGKYEIETGVGFFDHMLALVACHGMFDLDLKAKGDLHVDGHHTIEDCALALGQALDQALGDRRGICRIGSAFVPMDEALAFVAVDLSGRPYAVVEADWSSPTVGEMPTSLVTHFFESLSTTARANVHARLLYGRDDHHKIEALFKSLGRSLDAATQLDPRREGSLPSTKGVL
jgi:imidazoleglycerol-phosphate dehydratase